MQDLVLGPVELHDVLTKYLLHCSNWSSVVISHIATQKDYIVNFRLLYFLEEF